VTLNFLQNSLSVVEPLFAVAVLAIFLRARDQASGRPLTRKFPALTTYLVLRSISVIVLDALLQAPHYLHVSAAATYVWYFAVYWTSYVLCAVAIFFLIQEILQYAMEPLPGLRRLGLLAFRWVGLISVIVAVSSSVSPVKFSAMLLPAIAGQLMRCVSLLELCLLAFIILSLQTLGLSMRSKAFGVSIGLGLLASLELAGSVLMGQPGTSLMSGVNQVYQVCALIAWATWGVYFILPEPQRRAVTIPVSSPLLRWNEIAVALGHSTPHVAVGSSGDFFLQDVEKVVDKILTKNSMNTAG
jgi:hypothetical protein